MEARKSRLASKVSTWEVTLREKGGLREAPGVEGSSCGHAGGRSHGRPCPERRRAEGSLIPSQTRLRELIPSSPDN